MTTYGFTGSTYGFTGDSKEDIVAKASKEKEDNLINTSDISVIDGDTLKTPEGKVRLNGFDAFEIKKEHPTVAQTKQLNQNREYLAGIFGLPTALIPNESVYKRGNEATKLTSDILSKHEQVAIDKTGQHTFDRVVANVRDPKTNQDILQSLNTPENNPNWDSRYNAVNKLNYTLQQDIIDSKPPTPGALSNNESADGLDYLNNLGRQFGSGLIRTGINLVQTATKPAELSGKIRIPKENLDLAKSISLKKDKGIELTKEENKFSNSVDYYDASIINFFSSFNKETDTFQKIVEDRVNNTKVAKYHKQATDLWNYVIAPNLENASKQFAEGKFIDGNISYIKATTSAIIGHFNLGIDNPKAVGEVVANSLPDSYLAKKSIVLAGISNFVDATEKNYKEFVKEHKGKEPNTSDWVKLLTSTFIGTVADVGGDKFVFKGKQDLGTKSVVEGLSESITTASGQVASGKELDPASIFADGSMGAHAGTVTASLTNPIQSAKDIRDAFAQSLRGAGNVASIPVSIDNELRRRANDRPKDNSIDVTAPETPPLLKALSKIPRKATIGTFNATDKILTGTANVLEGKPILSGTNTIRNNNTVNKAPNDALHPKNVDNLGKTVKEASVIADGFKTKAIPTEEVKAKTISGIDTLVKELNTKALPFFNATNKKVAKDPTYEPTDKEKEVALTTLSTISGLLTRKTELEASKAPIAEVVKNLPDTEVSDKDFNNVIGSVEFSSDEEVAKVKEELKGKLSKEQLDILDIATTKTSKDVGEEIRKGTGKKFKGIKSHILTTLRDIDVAKEIGNTSLVEEDLSKLSTWKDTQLAKQKGLQAISDVINTEGSTVAQIDNEIAKQTDAGMFSEDMGDITYTSKEAFKTLTDAVNEDTTAITKAYSVLASKANNELNLDTLKVPDTSSEDILTPTEVLKEELPKQRKPPKTTAIADGFVLHPAVDSIVSELNTDTGSLDSEGKRQPSVNPEWFKNNSFLPRKVKGTDEEDRVSKSPSIKKIRDTLDLYNKGENLTKSEARIIEELHAVAVAEEEFNNEQYTEEQKQLTIRVRNIENSLIEQGKEDFIDELHATVEDPTILPHELDEELNAYETSIEKTNKETETTNSEVTKKDEEINTTKGLTTDTSNTALDTLPDNTNIEDTIKYDNYNEEDLSNNYTEDDYKVDPNNYTDLKDEVATDKPTKDNTVEVPNTDNNTGSNKIPTTPKEAYLYTEKQLGKPLLNLKNFPKELQYVVKGRFVEHVYNGEFSEDSKGNIPTRLINPKKLALQARLFNAGISYVLDRRAGKVKLNYLTNSKSFMLGKSLAENMIVSESKVIGDTRINDKDFKGAITEINGVDTSTVGKIFPIIKSKMNTTVGVQGKYNKTLLNILEKVIAKDTRIEFLSELTFEGRSVIGLAYPGDKIQLALPTNGDLSALTVLQEIIHMTVDEKIFGDNPTPDAIKIKNEIKDLVTKFRKAIDARGNSLGKLERDYVKQSTDSNLNEFITYSLTNEVVQNLMRETPYTSTSKFNLFQVFTNKVRSLLGLKSIPNTLLEHALSVSFAALNEASTQPKTLKSDRLFSFTTDSFPNIPKYVLKGFEADATKDIQAELDRLTTPEDTEADIKEVEKRLHKEYATVFSKLAKKVVKLNLPSIVDIDLDKFKEELLNEYTNTKFKGIDTSWMKSIKVNDITPVKQVSLQNTLNTHDIPVKINALGSFGKKGIEKLSNVVKLKPVNNILNNYLDIFKPEITSTIPEFKELSSNEFKTIIELKKFLMPFKEAFINSRDPYVTRRGTGTNKAKTKFKVATDDLMDLLIPLDISTDTMKDKYANLSYALGISGLNWLNTSGLDSLYNDKDTIRATLGMNPTNILSDKTYHAFANLGTQRLLVANSIGGDFLNSIGITAKKSGVPAVLFEKLKTSIGLHAITQLVSLGYLEESTMPSDIYNSHKQGNSGLDKDGNEFTEFSNNEVNTFVKAVPIDNAENKYKLDSSISELLKNFKGKEATALLNKLFGFKSKFTKVNTEIPTREDIPKQYRNSVTDLPEALIDVVEAYSSIPSQPDIAVLDMYKRLGDDLVTQIFGGYSKQEIDEAYVLQRLGMKGTNLGIERQLNILRDYKENTDISLPIYFKNWLGKNLRVFMDGDLNTQSYKAHRYAIDLKDSIRTIDSNKSEDRKQFMMIVLEALGEKVTNTSEYSTVKDKFDSLINTPKIAKAIEAIKGENTEENNLAILTGVKKGGEKGYSFKALMALTKYSETKAFETALVREVDGTTNGTANAFIQFAGSVNNATLDKILNAAGFFRNSVDNYDTQKGNIKNLDNYENTASTFVDIKPTLDEALLEGASSITFDDISLERQNILDNSYKALQDILPDTNIHSFIEAMTDVIGTLKNPEGKVSSVARSLFKPALMVINYGAGIASIVNGMSEEFLNDFYIKLSKANLIENKELRGIELTKLTNTFNTIALNTGKDKVDFNVDKPMDLYINPSLLETFKYNAGLYLRPIVGEALGKDFSELKENSSVLNDGLLVMFEIFKLKHAKAIIQFKKDNKDNTPSKEEHDEIIRSLIDYIPRIHFNDSNEALNDASILSSSKKVSKDPSSKVSIRYKDKEGNIKQAKAGVLEDQFDGLGIRAVPQAVIITDALTMHEFIRLMSAKGNGFTGTHDAGYFGKDIEENAKLFNQAHSNTLDNYHPAKAIQEVVLKALDLVINDTSITREFPKIFKTMGIRFYNSNAKTKHIYNNLNEFKNSFKSKTDSIVEDSLNIKNDFINRENYYAAGSLGKSAYIKESENISDTTPKTEQTDLLTQFNVEIDNGLNSSSEASIPKDAFKGDKTKVTVSNALEVLNSLPEGSIKDSEAHSTYLRESLSELITGLLKPIDLYIQNNDGNTFGFITKNMDKIFLNIASKANKDIPNSVVPMSPATTYVHELNHAIIVPALEDKANYTLKLQLSRLLNNVRKAVIEDDKANGTDNFTKYAHIFDNKNVTKIIKENEIGNSSVTETNMALAEFSAFTKSEPEFRKLLNRLEGTVTRKVFVGSIIQTVGNIIAKILQYWNKTFKDHGSNSALVQADRLILSLATINAKREASMLDKFEISKAMEDKLDSYLHKASNYGLNLLKKDFISKNSLKIIRNPANTIIKAVEAKIVFQAWHATMNEFSLMMGTTEHNIINALATEAEGETVLSKNYHRLLSLSNHVINQLKETNSEVWSKMILNQYHKDTKLDDRTKQAIAKGLLATDMSSLMDKYSLNDMAKLLTDTKYITKELKTVKDKLTSTYKSKGTALINQSMNLGVYMSSGSFIEGIDGVHNVAQVIKFAGLSNLKEDEYNSLVEDITQLSRLYAIKYTSKEDKDITANVIKEELSNQAKDSSKGNGILFTLDHHNLNKEEYLKDILKGNKNLIKDGYTKDVFNPNLSVVIGTLDEETRLISQGYTRSLLPKIKSKMDASKEDLYVYTSKVGSNMSYQKMIFSLTKLNNNISDYSDGYIMSEDTRDTMTKFIKPRYIRRQLTQSNSRLFTRVLNEDTILDNTSDLATIYNKDLKIIGYKYIMNHNDKNTLLERDTDFSNILAIGRAEIADKLNTQDINKKAVDLMFEDFNDTVHRGNVYAKQFVDISTDKEYANQFKMLPEETRNYINGLWGDSEVYIRRDMAKILLGYRNQTITDWIRPTDITDKHENSLLRVMGNSFSKLINPKFLKNSELILKDYVKLKKDAIVIKSGTVLGYNILSNDTLLWLKGVNAHERINGYATASIALENYLADAKKLNILKSRIDIDNTKPSNNRTLATKHRIRLKTLQDRVDSNPVKDLIDLAVFQSFVEDISNNELDNSFKSKINEIIEPINNKIPSGLKTIGNEAIMGHETKLYQFLKHTTQYSDFVARYILNEHNLKSGMTQDESLTDINETFVQYDLPTHPTLQYLNDIGLVMFSKFFIRIQKVILKSVVRKPARALILMLSNTLFGFDNILSSTATLNSALFRISNPVNPEPFTELLIYKPIN